MAFNDFVTLEKDECVDWLEAILIRPEIYAQNAGSLEDQFCLLAAILWDGNSHFVNVYETFRCKHIGTTVPTAANFFEGISRKLRLSSGHSSTR